MRKRKLVKGFKIILGIRYNNLPNHVNKFEKFNSLFKANKGGILPQK